MWGIDRFLIWEMRKREMLKLLSGWNQVLPASVLHKEAALVPGSFIHLIPTIANTVPGMEQ